MVDKVAMTSSKRTLHERLRGVSRHLTRIAIKPRKRAKATIFYGFAMLNAEVCKRRLREEGTGLGGDEGGKVRGGSAGSVATLRHCRVRDR